MLTSLSASTFRLLDVQLCFSSGINVIWGENGSGKSTILEAIYYMAHGRSFRTSNVKNLVSNGQNGFLIRAKVLQNDSYDLALQRSMDGFSAKLNQQKTSLSSLAKQLPVVFIDCDSHRHFFCTPMVRRRLFDWLVFHVKPS